MLVEGVPVYSGLLVSCVVGFVRTRPVRASGGSSEGALGTVRSLTSSPVGGVRMKGPEGVTTRIPYWVRPGQSTRTGSKVPCVDTGVFPTFRSGPPVTVGGHRFRVTSDDGLSE